MSAETKQGGYGWMPPFGTPIYFEGEELPGGAPAPDASPPDDTAPALDPPTEAPGGEAPIDAPPPPPWEGKTPEELWNRNQELTNENADYRKKYHSWKEAAEGLAPEDVDFYRDFLVAVKNRDQAKLGELGPQMRAALDALSPAQQQALADAAEEAQEEFDPFDRSQVEKIAEEKAQRLYEERERAREQEAAVQKALSDMNTRLSELGRPESEGGVGIPELGDPTTPEYATVLWMAKNDPEVAAIGDPMDRLGKAAQKYRDRLDERAQALLKAKSAAAATPASPQAGHTPSGSKVPKSFDEAKASADARLDKILRASQETVGT